MNMLVRVMVLHDASAIDSVGALLFEGRSTGGKRRCSGVKCACDPMRALAMGRDDMAFVERAITNRPKAFLSIVCEALVGRGGRFMRALDKG